MSELIVTESAAISNIVPRVWGEYTLRQNPTLYSAVWVHADGAMLGRLAYDKLTGYYVDVAMTADDEYVPAFEGWERYIAADVDSLNALAGAEGRAA